MLCNVETRVVRHDRGEGRYVRDPLAAFPDQGAGKPVLSRDERVDDDTCCTHEPVVNGDILRRVKHPDLYQLLGYVTATGLSSGLLVYAKGEEMPATHQIPLAGKLLHVRSLQLAGDQTSLRSEIRKLAALVLTLSGVSGGQAA